MGDLILLSERMADLSRPSHAGSAFFFALGCPFSYLAAERVERTFGEIDWIPLPGPLGHDGTERDSCGELMAAAGREAVALRLPFLTPERPLGDPRPAARAAAFAAQRGVAARFTLAVSRLVFCGGFALDDPETVAEAAGAANLPAAATLAAAADPRHDEQLDATARGLQGRGVGSSPVIRIGRRWFSGLDAVPGASSFAATAATYGGPSSPAI
jgi:2-hydroxychromene-2-carboxylate isomerase